MKLTRRHITIIAVPVLLISALCVRPAKALFFDITHDPINWVMLSNIWGEDISTGAKLIKEFNQLVKIYTTGEQMYQSAMYMRQSFGSGMRMSWLSSIQRGVDNYTQNKYGETTTWPAVMNGMPAAAPGAWTSATVPMYDPNPFMGTLNPELARKLQAKIASVEIADGSSVKCLQTIAQQRANSDRNLAALSALTSTFLQGDSKFNSLIQQLNLQNGHSQQQLAMAREQSAMQNCLVENQIVANKIQRDQEVESINGSIQTQQIVSDPNNQWDGQLPIDFKVP